MDSFEPRPPYVETADEVEAILRHRGMVLWRFLPHEWWRFSTRYPPASLSDSLRASYEGVGVTDPALHAWLQRHGLPDPPAADCVCIEHPKFSRR